MFNSPYLHIAASRPGQFVKQTSGNAARNADRLRRHGYADGERQPRKPNHWANR